MVTTQTIQKHVEHAVRKADLTNTSAKQIRQNVEKELSLNSGHLSTEKWKKVVNRIIERTMEDIEREQEEHKIEDDSDGSMVNDSEELKSRKSVGKSMGTKKRRKRIESPTSMRDSPAPQLTESTPQDKKQKIEVDDDDSDTSVLIDSTPPSKSKPRQKKTAATKATRAKPAPNKPTDSSSSVDQIKFLKSLVYKCGLRKNWFTIFENRSNSRTKEFQSDISTQEQITRLHAILKSLGMPGKPSEEKARRIKEQKELKDELEFIQEGARNLGTGKRSRGS